MEKKLIELLNEYRTEKLRREMYVNWADKETIELSEAERINEYEVSQTLDSLNYLRLFIKWLVDNDKIDFRKLDPKLNDSIPTRYYLWTYIRYSFEKEILMALSIQDNSIEFLCSILK